MEEHNLLTHFAQVQYYFDIREKPPLNDIIKKLNQLLLNSNSEVDKIQDKMKEIKKLKSPFTIFDDL